MQIRLIVHNIRSTHNVGSVLRTADGFGVNRVYFTGYSPYPSQPNDDRLPHIHKKLTEQIHKTALGAEVTMPTEHVGDIVALVRQLRGEGFKIVALEQNPQSIRLDLFEPAKNIALLLGEETKGITKDLLALCDESIEIPMHGKKESFNVGVAAGIALYQLSLNRLK